MSGQTPSYRMLIADDDSGFRDTLRSIFERQFDLLEAENGEEAIEIAEAETLDIALLDMNMPHLTGLETLQALRSVRILFPCILITANATDELRKRATQADAFSVLRKPVRKMELVVAVSDALEIPGQRETGNLLN